MGSSSLTRDRTWAPALGVWSLSHWATREVPPAHLFKQVTIILFMTSLLVAKQTSSKALCRSSPEEDQVQTLWNFFSDYRFMGSQLLSRAHLISKRRALLPRQQPVAVVQSTFDPDPKLSLLEALATPIVSPEFINLILILSGNLMPFLCSYTHFPFLSKS